MQPAHNCSQDCETLHKEISKKIVLIISGSRICENSSSVKSSNWFGLEVPFGAATGLFQCHEETIKSLCCSAAEQRILRVLVYLDNEDGTIGAEDGREGVKIRKGPARKGKLLMEVWTIRFHPKIITLSGEDEIRKVYKRTSLFIRSLYTITRLLPIYPLIYQKLPIHLEICSGEEEALSHDRSVALSESFVSTEPPVTNDHFESVNRTDLSLLQTGHGDLDLSVEFKKISVKLYTIVRSPAIRVPQQVIKAKDIQIRSSPVLGSGDWVDMTQQQQQNHQHQHQQSLRKNKSNPNSHSQSHTLTKMAQGQVKILTTGHKPSSSLVPESRRIPDISDFIKIFEKVPQDLLTPSSSIISGGPTQILQLLETGRSKKIHFDRWLEELEIEHEESFGFDLLNNME